jgi:hypothetical protein
MDQPNAGSARAANKLRVNPVTNYFADTSRQHFGSGRVERPWLFGISESRDASNLNDINFTFLTLH